MATYYHGNSEIQGGGGGGGDGLQTLILMNPAYVGGYSDAQQPQQPSNGNFVFLNNNSSANTLPHAPPSHSQHFVGIPLHGGGNAATATTTSPQDHPQHHDVSVLHGFLPRVPYNLYNLPMDPGAAREVTRAQQGLSLSLSSQQPPPPPGYGSFRQEREQMPSQPLVTAVSSPPRGGDDVRASPSSASGVSNGVNGVQSVLLSSKYLKAAQELLDEVVNVGKGAKTTAESSKGPQKSTGDSAAAAASGDGAQSGGESSAKRGAELTTAERQEIQMKKAKLVNMLDEVRK